MLHFSLSFLGLISSLQVVPPPSPTFRRQEADPIYNVGADTCPERYGIYIFVNVQSKITLPYDYTIL